MSWALDDIGSGKLHVASVKIKSNKSKFELKSRLGKGKARHIEN